VTRAGPTCELAALRRPPGAMFSYAAPRYPAHPDRVFLRTRLAETDNPEHMIAVARQLHPSRPEPSTSQHGSWVETGAIRAYPIALPVGSPK
jgi:hypothetical protein